MLVPIEGTGRQRFRVFGWPRLRRMRGGRRLSERSRHVQPLHGVLLLRHSWWWGRRVLVPRVGACSSKAVGEHVLEAGCRSSPTDGTAAAGSKQKGWIRDHMVALVERRERLLLLLLLEMLRRIIGCAVSSAGHETLRRRFKKRLLQHAPVVHAGNHGGVKSRGCGEVLRVHA